MPIPFTNTTPKKYKNIPLKKCKMLREPSKNAFFSFHNARRVFGSRRRRRREPRVSPSFKRASPPVAATTRSALRFAPSSPSDLRLTVPLLDGALTAGEASASYSYRLCCYLGLWSSGDPFVSTWTDFFFTCWSVTLALLARWINLTLARPSNPLPCCAVQHWSEF